MLPMKMQLNAFQNRNKWQEKQTLIQKFELIVCCCTIFVESCKGRRHDNLLLHFRIFHDTSDQENEFLTSFPVHVGSFLCLIYPQLLSFAPWNIVMRSVELCVFHHYTQLENELIVPISLVVSFTDVLGLINFIFNRRPGEFHLQDSQNQNMRVFSILLQTLQISSSQWI